MKIESFSHLSSLPSDSPQRIEMVIKVCVKHGYVNRQILVECYELTPLQASVLLREFLIHRIRYLKRDIKQGGFVLLGT